MHLSFKNYSSIGPGKLWGGGGGWEGHALPFPLTLPPPPPPPPPPRTFLRRKKKKEKKGKKERFSKQKLLKGCHQGQNATVLAILECLEFLSANYGGRQCFSVFHGPSDFEIHFASPDQEKQCFQSCLADEKSDH